MTIAERRSARREAREARMTEAQALSGVAVDGAAFAAGAVSAPIAQCGQTMPRPTAIDAEAVAAEIMVLIRSGMGGLHEGLFADLLRKHGAV